MDSFISLNGLSPELMNTASTASIVWTSGSPTKSEQYTISTQNFLPKWKALHICSIEYFKIEIQ